jgi:hypothetical protein
MRPSERLWVEWVGSVKLEECVLARLTRCCALRLCTSPSLHAIAARWMVRAFVAAQTKCHPPRMFARPRVAKRRKRIVCLISEYLSSPLLAASARGGGGSGSRPLVGSVSLSIVSAHQRFVSALTA